MSFGRYVDLVNMSEEPTVSMPSVKTQPIDSSETPFSVLFSREMTRETAKRSGCGDKFDCGRRGKNRTFSTWV